jgi:hypothetical protein
MKDGRKGMGINGNGETVANDAAFTAESSAVTLSSNEKVLTSPAFDRWLERQVQTLFAACEEPADPKLVELIRQAFPAGGGKVTE